MDANFNLEHWPIVYFKSGGVPLNDESFEEFGIPNNDSRWLTVMDNFLQYLNENNIGGCYWAAGRWWKDYPLSIEPTGSTDKPQMNLFAKYLGQNNKSAVAKNYNRKVNNNSDTYPYNSYATNK